MSIKIVVIAAFICWLSIALTTAESVCGDANWEPYKDEYCFKVFDVSSLETFTDAITTCQANTSHLVTIRYAEEQQFLVNYLFKRSKVLDGVWIGGHFDDASRKYKWHDGSDLTYTNWAPEQPKLHSDYCIEMHSEEELLGKWFTVPCGRRNVVLCQKAQPWTKAVLEETVRELKHSLLLMQTKQSQLEQKLVGAETKLAATEAKLIKTEQSIVPLGTVYVQLPKEPSPETLWPSMNWTDISSTYAGLFFRTEGGSSAEFGIIQEANTTGIISDIAVDSGVKVDVKGHHSISLQPGTWSPTILSGAVYSSNNYNWRLFTTEGEVRPRNMAMKIWRRSG